VKLTKSDLHLTVPAPPGLVLALRQRTSAQHSRAERSGIVASLLRGEATLLGYAVLLRNLLPVYRQMEASLGRLSADDPVAVISRTEIYRSSALRSDLLRLCGPDWARNLPVLAAARRYVDLVARADGPRLVAHAYVRYLGDLSGGQILRRLLGRSLGLDDSSLAFYAFPEVGDIDVFKAEYRDAIDAIGQGMDDVALLLDEAVAVFEANIELSDAIARYVARRPDISLSAPRAPLRGR
jgi:heme oxygenase (biliverdin-producing, ferredoxin)